MKTVSSIISVVLIVSACSKKDLSSEKPLHIQKETQTSSVNARVVSAVSGQGTLILDFYNGGAQHFSFHGQVDINGDVRGTWESRSPGQDLRTHGLINCISFLDDNTAFITGVVIHKDGQGFPGQYEVGMPVWFKVRDNGEGDNAQPDEFTDYYSLDGIECVNYEQASMHPIAGGNIRVSR